MMSRNLCDTHCQFCGECDTVELVEDRRPIREDEAGCYFEEYEGMLVANAACNLCEAKYLAWVDERPLKRPRFWLGVRREPRHGDPFFDLSHRSTFNDEPGEEDMPMYKVERVVTYKYTPWT
jgi:hypothetical protein